MDEKLMVVLVILIIGAMFVKFVDVFPKIMVFARGISVALALFALFSNWEQNYPLIKKIFNLSMEKGKDLLVYIYNFAINNSDEFMEAIKTIAK
ncbi:MAG: hypothetical protein N4A68_05445 [Maledivibacter sp.]|jgi:hypothetical protein|nr:hypothetical protein [Maledivibacter sp.]